MSCYEKQSSANSYIFFCFFASKFCLCLPEPRCLKIVCLLLEPYSPHGSQNNFAFLVVNPSSRCIAARCKSEKTMGGVDLT